MTVKTWRERLNIREERESERENGHSGGLIIKGGNQPALLLSLRAFPPFFSPVQSLGRWRNYAGRKGEMKCSCVGHLFCVQMCDLCVYVVQRCIEIKAALRNKAIFYNTLILSDNNSSPTQATNKKMKKRLSPNESYFRPWSIPIDCGLI